MVPAMMLAIESAELTLPRARSSKRAMWRGFTRHCPHCGTGHLFCAFLKVVDTCPHCGEELHHQRADDAPPYFTLFIIAHLVVPSVLVVEWLWHPPLLAQAILWSLVTLALSFALMPSVKGAIVGLQWALRMHGFDLSAARREDMASRT
ncbi:MAG: DUF983 domain-containing protein [Rhizobiales bacterium]|nr:DUF983 domain-containing protein [Hyphomicrobiales bacterium]MBI3673836.1 DUF983 domain-containing protein [Hyphomicrobiales bacterium]